MYVCVVCLCLWLKLYYPIYVCLCVQVKLWHANRCYCFVTFREHQASVSDLQFVQSGRAVLSASLDGTVRAFDTGR